MDYDSHEQASQYAHHLRNRNRKSKRRKSKNHPSSSRNRTTRTTDCKTVAATVISSARQRATVRTDHGETALCTLEHAIAQEQGFQLAVGDRVVVEVRQRTYHIRSVEKRRSLLCRPDPHVPSRARAIVANVDRVVIVAAAQDPPLRPRLIDRYLVAIGQGGAEPIIAINKIDLLDDSAALTPLVELYRAIGVPVVMCSASEGSGLEALRSLLTGHVCAFVGHSGVGKSSLLNALLGQSVTDEGNVRAFDGKGRHTTTGSQLYDLPGNTSIIDTPGIRSFGLWRLERHELERYFREFHDAAQRCAYGNCTHVQEPGCEVRNAVEEGHISEMRYDSYLRMLESLE